MGLAVMIKKAIRRKKKRKSERVKVERVKKERNELLRGYGISGFVPRTLRETRPRFLCKSA